MSHLPLDARAILDYLNELGYRNISAEQLKEFMKDLRKLIKYEESLGINANQPNYFENLFKRTTASFRAKLGKENGRGERVVELKTKREHERHVLRPLSQIEHHHQQQQTSARGGEMTTSHAARTGTSKPNVRGAENLSRERAWQTGDRVPFGECNEPRKAQQPADATTDQYAPSTSRKVGLTAREVEQKGTKHGGGQVIGSGTGGVGAARDVSVTAKGAKPHAGVMAREENWQRNQPGGATTRDASNRTGRTRVRTPSQERGATGRSQSGGSYTTARSLGVMIPRHCTATRRRRPLSTDPVALYHYYQSEWNYFRQQIPGESSHAELRWLVRARLMDPN